MVAQVKRQRWFRWHDAGDIQSVDHMKKNYGGLQVNTRHPSLAANSRAQILTASGIQYTKKFSDQVIRIQGRRTKIHGLDSYIISRNEGRQLPRTITGRQMQRMQSLLE